MGMCVGITRSPGVVAPRKYEVCADSTTAQAGDPVVKTTNSSLTTSSVPVFRPVLAADISALYKESSSVCGILGFNCDYWKTDSSGVANTPNTPSTKSGSAEPVRPAPTLASIVPNDPTTTYAMSGVYYMQPGVRARVKVKSTVTPSAAIVGTTAGIDLTSGVYTLDTAATTKIFLITDWYSNDLTTVEVELLPAYQQLALGNNYSSQ